MGAGDAPSCRGSTGRPRRRPGAGRRTPGRREARQQELLPRAEVAQRTSERTSRSTAVSVLRRARRRRQRTASTSDSTSRGAARRAARSRRRARRARVHGEERLRPRLERQPAPDLKPDRAAADEVLVELLAHERAVHPPLERSRGARAGSAPRRASVRAARDRSGSRSPSCRGARARQAARGRRARGAGSPRARAVELLGVGQRERELHEAVVEERQARLDRERHRVAVLVAQQARQLADERVEREVAPRRSARRAASQARRSRRGAATPTARGPALPGSARAAPETSAAGSHGSNVQQRRREAELVRTPGPTASRSRQKSPARARSRRRDGR